MHKKFFLQFALIATVALLATALSLNKPLLDRIVGFIIRKDVSSVKLTGKVKINQTIVDVEVADTPAKRQQGLGGRESLEQSRGMLFVFEKGDKYKFWMKGLSFPLDFIWIRDLQIVDLAENIAAADPGQSDETLEVITPKEKVDMVLEVNAGFIQANNIKIGDKIEFIQ